MTISTTRVYTTDFGRHTEADLPEEIRDELRAAVYRKNGLIDRRYKRSRDAWALLVLWSRNTKLAQAYVFLSPTETPFQRAVLKQEPSNAYMLPTVDSKERGQ